MSLLDWIVLSSTLLFIAIYGWWHTRSQEGIKDYLLGDQSQKWWQVGLAVMATQASAITFISTTGQGYSDGLRFVQFYFGLPLAMIVICVVFIPTFYKLKVFTAYEYLEQRFDLKTRLFASIIFLIQRGLAAGITLYAPSIILSAVFGWNLQWTHVISGIVVILYTVSGGSRAVSVTQMHQVAVIFIGMVFAFGYMIWNLPAEISLNKGLQLAGWMNKMNAVDFSLDFKDRYNFWSGITGGFFLALAYFGTDQSQVQRYLTGKNIQQSRMGLIFNGILKIPMQVFILMCGVMLYVFLMFQNIPLSFNEKVNQAFKNSKPELYQQFATRNDSLNAARRSLLSVQNESIKSDLIQVQNEQIKLRKKATEIVIEANPTIEANDRDYIFLHYILNYLPKGLIGLLIAVILCAAMSSISAELNALSGVSYIDIYKRLLPGKIQGLSEVAISKGFAIFWGIVALSFAFFARLFENLIQFINIIGSLFYGSVLGIFLVAFLFKWIKSSAVFYAACVAQITVIGFFMYSDLGFLWYNVISVCIVIILSFIIQFVVDNFAIKKV
ncbi:MAG: sodium:solute symporter [Saprospiraceae bacterium]